LSPWPASGHIKQSQGKAEVFQSEEPCSITTQCVQVEHGLFSKVKDNLELFRLDYFDVLRPISIPGIEDSGEHVPRLLLRERACCHVPSMEQMQEPDSHDFMKVA
jgi:hypothetical protein